MDQPSSPAPRRTSSLALGVAGAALLVTFGLLAYGTVGMQIQYKPPWQSFGRGELMFWFCNMLLLLPGSLMLGWSVSTPLSAALARHARALAAQLMRPRVLMICFVALFALFYGLRRLILFDLPITDDEHAARFGGQVLASGSWLQPVSPLWGALPHEFIYVRDGVRYQSFDWPGILFAWALATKTGLESALFTLAAAATPPLVAAGVTRRATPAWGVAALLIFCASPMAQTLSWTAHAHVLSRAGVAATFLLVWWAREEGARAWRWALVGLTWGAAMLVRPLESAALCAPLILLATYELVRQRRLTGALCGALGVGAMIALFMLFNHKITGDMLIHARFADVSSGARPHYKPPLAFLSDQEVLLNRLANNTAYNLSMILAWFATPLAAALAALGVRDRWDGALGLGLLGALSLSLIHDDFGLHIVGPIHYSEVVVPMTYLLIGGLRTLHEQLRPVSARAVPALIAGLILWGLCTTGAQGRALRQQGLIHHTTYATFEDDPFYHNSLILAPRYGEVWMKNPEFKATGAWVFQWRPMSPTRDEPVIFLHHNPKLIDLLRATFPDRKLFVLEGSAEPPHMRITPLDEHQRAQQPNLLRRMRR